MKITFNKLYTPNIEDATNVVIEAYKMPPWYSVWSIEQAQKSITVIFRYDPTNNRAAKYKR